MKQPSEMTLRELVKEIMDGCGDSMHHSNRDEYDVDDWIPGWSRAVAAKNELERRLPALEAAEKLASRVDISHRDAKTLGAFAENDRLYHAALDAYRAAKEAERNAD